MSKSKVAETKEPYFNDHLKGKAVEEAYRKAATKNHHVAGECEIDDGAVVSISADHGAYVQAWVWVDNDDIPPTTRKKLGMKTIDEDED